MAGNANSGRKTRWNEVQSGKLTQRLIVWANEMMDKGKFSKDELLRLLLTFGPKYITQSHEHSGQVDLGLKELIGAVNQTRKPGTVNRTMARVSDN